MDNLDCHLVSFESLIILAAAACFEEGRSLLLHVASDFLLPHEKDWKNGEHPLGNVPPYNPNLEDDAPGDADIQLPELSLCIPGKTSSGKNTLSLPAEVRAKWLDDPVRRDSWQEELKNFDSRLLSPITRNTPRKLSTLNRRRHRRHHDHQQQHRHQRHVQLQIQTSN